jgi:endogenous inhibitor of DNA gyrase (YacG/DUF329 family)
MIETCPLCGRYSLSREYPPRPCPICEEEVTAKSATSVPVPLRHRPTPEQSANV